MRIIAKSLLVGLAVIAAVAISAAPSEAAKKKMKAKCDPIHSCAAACKGNTCELNRCDPDGKVHSAFPPTVCVQPNCPAKC